MLQQQQASGSMAASGGGSGERPPIEMEAGSGAGAAERGGPAGRPAHPQLTFFPGEFGRIGGAAIQAVAAEPHGAVLEQSLRPGDASAFFFAHAASPGGPVELVGLPQLAPPQQQTATGGAATGRAAASTAGGGLFPAHALMTAIQAPPPTFGPYSRLADIAGGGGSSGKGGATTGVIGPPGAVVSAQPQGGGAGQQLPPSCSLYVKNLPPETDKLFLYERFAPFGAIHSVRVLLDDATGKCRGVGFINYADQPAALRAIQALHGTKIGDKLLHVSLQSPRVRGGGPPGGGGGGSAFFVIPHQPPPPGPPPALPTGQQQHRYGGGGGGPGVGEQSTYGSQADAP